MSKILMIGVSTAQNTTNVLPALQLKVDYFIAIETSKATKNNWSLGMNSVLKKRGIKVLSPIQLKKEEDSRIDLIYKQIKDISLEETEVIWNLGGGQKAQQFAMWQAFMHRSKQGINEVACYANPENKKIELWEFDKEKNELEYFDENTNSTLTAAEIFEIYGFQLEIENTNLLYSNDKTKNSNQKLYELLDYQDFRKFFFNLPKTSPANESNQNLLSKKEFVEMATKIDDAELKKIFKKLKKNNQPINESVVVPQLRKEIVNRMKALFNKPPSNKKIKIFDTKLKEKLYNITGKEFEYLEVSYRFFNTFFPNYSKMSFLFEEMLSEKIQNILLNNKNYVLEAYTNVNLSKDKNVIAEYDVLLVTKWGTIISIDAKTFGVAKKDIDARILNLRKGAGRYIEFALCFPYYLSDIDKEWFPNEIKKLPQKLDKYHLKYFMLNDKTNVSKLLVDDQKINIIPIDCFLEQFKLLKK